MGRLTAGFCGGGAQLAPPPRRLLVSASPRRSPLAHRPRPPHLSADPRGRPPSAGERPAPKRAPLADERSKYAHLPADEAAELAALDALAEEWIGGSIARWEWYERLKARRERLRARTAARRAEVDGQMGELRGVLMQVDALLGVGLVDEKAERVTVAGWAAVAVVGLANLVVAYACLELANGAVMAAFPAAEVW